jgi:molecular chaperone HscA
VAATRKALAVDADLLDAGERRRIEEACSAVERAAAGADPSKLQARIDALDDVTKEFAGRRMNRAIARAIEGRRVELVEENVKSAKTIEEAHTR